MRMGQRRETGLAATLLLTMLGACIPNPDRPDSGYRPPRDRAEPRWRDDRPRRDPRDDAPPERYEPHRIDERVSALPAPPPAWQARPVSADAATIDTTTYLVRPGDTLRAIADRTGGGSEAIARANQLPPPFVVRTGQRLTIPGGRYHLVRAGQTGIAIARAYAVDWSRIIAANDLTAPYTLRVGMRVLIPGTAGGSSAAERAKAFTLDIDDILTGSEPALAANQRPAQPTASPRRVLAPTQALAEPAQLTSGFAWPVHGKIITRFGPGASGEKFNGVNIAVPIGTPILASADGVVAYAGSGVPTLGGLVIVKHGSSWTTVYANASQLLVRRGQAVKRGQTIALSGDSGQASRPEVHFEMRKGRTPVDPQRQLPGI